MSITECGRCKGGGIFNPDDNLTTAIRCPWCRPTPGWTPSAQEPRKLYPFQVEGAAWLADNPRALLGDDMGLGKTPQAIRAADRLMLKRIFVVAPKSAIYNWALEFEKFGLYERTVQVIDAGNQSVDPRVDVVVTTPRLMTRAHIRMGAYALKWDAVFVDEGHAYKNPETDQTRALYGDEVSRDEFCVANFAEIVWVLSGTPVRNHAGEIWTHVHALRPELIPSDHGRPLEYDEFIKRYCVTQLSRYGRKVVGNKRSTLQEIREKVIRPFILRRTKDVIADQLPPIRFDLTVLPPDGIEDELRRLEEEFADILPSVIEQIEGGIDEDLMLVALGNISESLPGGLTRLRHLTGLVKVPGTVSLLEEQFAAFPGVKVLVFAVHRGVIDALQEAAAQWNPAVITGDVTARNRQAQIDKFQTDDTCRLFIGQIQACGEAITLTAGSEVLFIEASWTPGDNSQAASRPHRIGQKAKCRVRFLALANSIDEAVMRVLRRKVKMTNELLAK